MHRHSDQDVESKIEELEAQFRGLHSCILKELKENKALDIEEVLHALTLLPTKIRNEYQKLILDKLPTLRSEESIYLNSFSILILSSPFLTIACLSTSLRSLGALV